MIKVIDDIEKIVLELQNLNSDLKEYISDSYINELTNKVKSMKEENICIEDIALFNDISVRQVIDILEL